MDDKPPNLPPTPGEPMHLRFYTLGNGLVLLHRFHLKKYQDRQFNDTSLGNARFSPIRNSSGDIIPTIYAGSSFECAAMETVFRDVAYGPPPKYFQKSKLKDFMFSTLLTWGEDLRLVDLSSKALRALNISRNELIDTDGDMYPVTRKWAEAIHAYAPDAQGLRWTSRQDDTAQCFVLFGDRIRPEIFALNRHNTVSVLDDEATYNKLLDLAEMIGARIVP
ncbi:RES family NAD+ phosphorylase [Pseudomonas sp. NPDC089569]|uniref:RES family NAD+ phosphorylase n=1 Tax=Pseudomonas sp. NPDC089569 TaxID=3390722 RepID=UPI003D08EC34